MAFKISSLTVLALVLLATSAGARPPVDLPTSVVGSAIVSDGDSIRIGAVRVRLHGIDAPEYSQPCKAVTGTWPCGVEAARTLVQLIGGREVSCERVPTAIDPNRRLIARVVRVIPTSTLR